MEDLIYLILIFLSFINVNFKGKNNYFNDYMELKNTYSIRGIFVWMIFFRHYTGYYPRNNNKISMIIDNSLSQNIVSLFLFYSGYGINESFKIKNSKYIKTLPIKTIILFLKSQLILLIFLLNNIFLGIKTSLKNYLYAIIFRKGIGNSYWFTFAILSLYVYSFFSFVFIKKKKLHFLGIIILTILCLFHIKFVYCYYHPKELISVDNIACFIFGFYYSYFKVYINSLIMFNDIIYYNCLSISLYVYYLYYVNPYRNTVIYSSIKNVFFSFFVILLTMKIQFNNEFLNLLNSHSYSIYLLQRVVMIFIRLKGYFENSFENSLVIGFFFEFFIVISISCVFDHYTNFIDKIIKNLSTLKIGNKKKSKFFQIKIV